MITNLRMELLEALVACAGSHLLGVGHVVVVVVPVLGLAVQRAADVALAVPVHAQAALERFEHLQRVDHDDLQLDHCTLKVFKKSCQ